MKANVLCSLTFLATLVAACSARESPPPPLEIHPGQFTAAQRCGDCHKDIYQVWTSSLHASSMTNSTFQASLRQAEETGESQSCLGCHAPAAMHSNQSADSPIAREGVTCDYCHSIRDVNAAGKAVSVTLDVGATKYGPVPNAHSTGHQVATSPLHASSEVCSGCHEYQNDAGLAVLATYTEWKASDSSKAGITCQRCHMPLSTLNVVDPRVKREPTSFVNLHQMPGGHSKDQLFKSLELRIAEITRRGSDLNVRITVTNKGAGHSVPTGMPTRQVVLVAEIAGAESGNQQQSKVYGATVVDKSGKTLDRDSQVMLTGARFSSDNRIRAGERRNESFKFRIKADENIQIRASLTYQYAPLGAGQPGLSIPFSERRQESMTQFNKEDSANKGKQ